MSRPIFGSPTYLILWLTIALPLAGQGPVNDRLEVTLPHTTWVGSVSIAPGKYTIRQLPTASNPRLLEFSLENGTKMETAITTFAALDNNNVRETSVVLEQRGGQYYLKNVWIGGKSYGYELPVEVRDQVAQRTETLTMTASSGPAATAAATATAAAAEPVAETRAPVVEKVVTPEPTPVAAVAPAPEAAAQAPVTSPQAEVQAPPVPAAVATQEQSTSNSGDGRLGAQTPPMPETASFWGDFVLGGIVLGFLSFIVYPSKRLGA